MPIKLKGNEIKDIVIKMGGVVSKNCPLRAKINGVVVDFISYGYSTEALIEVTNEMDLAKVVQTVNNFPQEIPLQVIFNGEIQVDKPLVFSKSNLFLGGRNRATIKNFCENNGVITIKGTEDKRLENIVVKNLIIDGNSTMEYKSRGIYVSYVGETIINSSENFDIDLCGIKSNIKNGIKIQDCVIQNNDIHGIHLNSSSNNTISGNTIQNNNSYGIFLYSSSNNNISGNIVSNNGSYGIHLYSSSSNNTISSNTIQNNNSYGIYLNSSNSNNTISGNTIQNNNSDGIYLYSSSNNNTISGNIVSNNGNNGIYLYSSSNNTISGNTIQNNNYNGIHLYSSSNNTISGNIVSNNGNNGIYLNSSSNNNLVSSNVSLSNVGTNIYNDATNKIKHNNK